MSNVNLAGDSHQHQHLIDEISHNVCPAGRHHHHHLVVRIATMPILKGSTTTTILYLRSATMSFLQGAITNTILLHIHVVMIATMPISQGATNTVVLEWRATAPCPSCKRPPSQQLCSWDPHHVCLARSHHQLHLCSWDHLHLQQGASFIPIISRSRLAPLSWLIAKIL